MSGLRNGFQDFRPSFSLLHRMGPMATDARQDPAQVTVRPGSSSPLEGHLLRAPRFRPLSAELQACVCGGPLSDTLCDKFGVLKAVGAARADPYWRTRTRALGNMGLESSLQGPDVKEESTVWVSWADSPHSGDHGGL